MTEVRLGRKLIHWETTQEVYPKKMRHFGYNPVSKCDLATAFVDWGRLVTARLSSDSNFNTESIKLMLLLPQRNAKKVLKPLKILEFVDSYFKARFSSSI